MKKKLIIAVVIFISALVGLHFYLLDGLDGWFWSSGFGDDTEYSPRYSDNGFRRVSTSMSSSDVRGLIGDPFKEEWKYPGNFSILFENGLLRKTYGQSMVILKEGTTQKETIAVLGAPLQKIWVYSRSPHDDSYRVRVVTLQNDHVLNKIHEFYID